MFSSRVLLWILWIQQVATDDDRPYLRILAPKFICNDKKANQTVNNNNLTISLQTKEGQQLRYQISVDFELVSGFKSQQHTLSIWKNIRLLEKKFSKSSKNISQQNQIEIDSKELTSDVVYTFKIVGYDDTNRASKMQNFSITFKGGQLKARQPDIGDGVSLLLLSSEFFYDDMEFLAVADVAFCDPINNYTFKWELDGFDSTEIGSVIGNALWLPSGTFKAGMQLQVVVKVLNADSLIMASARLPIKILTKDFKVSTAPAECLVGVDRDIPFQAFLLRQQTSAVTVAKWSCTKDDTACEGMKPASSQLGQLVSFSNEGTYLVAFDVTIDEVTKSSRTTVVVDSRVIPHVEIKIFPTQPVSVVQPNEFIVTVQNLIPKCFASWNVMTEEGFAKFNDIEGNFTDMGFILIKDFEEHFLNELVDYDNNTLSKDVTLSIPENALKPEENYKFRLTVTCPKPIVEGAPQTPNENVVSYFDIVVATNGPPETLPLVVKPLTGVAMKTKFKFSTGAAKDSTLDFPLKYTFGYIVNNMTVVIETFYENTVTHSQLPLSAESFVQTFVEVCDNNRACRRVAGPNVVVSSEAKFSEEEIEFKLSEFEASLKRAEFTKSFNLAVVFLLTQQKIVGETSSYETKMLAMMKLELEKLKVASQSDISKQKIVDFVKMSKGVVGLMTTADEAFVKDLLNLTDLVKSSEPRLKREAAERTGKILNHDPEYMKNVLSLSEILLSSKNATIVQQEKMKFLENIHNFVYEMCRQNADNQKMNSGLVAFEVSKIHSPQLSTEQLIMPENSATLLFSPNAIPAKFVCVAKIKFRMDVFLQEASEVRSSVFETMVIDDSAIGNARVMNANDVADFVNVEISTEDLSSTCLLWNGETWSSDGCTKVKVNSSSKIGCKCKCLGTASFVFKSGKAALKPTQKPEMTTKTNDKTNDVTLTPATKDASTTSPSPTAAIMTTTGSKASEDIKSSTGTEVPTKVTMTSVSSPSPATISSVSSVSPLTTTSISSGPSSTTSLVTSAPTTQPVSLTTQSTVLTTLEATTSSSVKTTLSVTTSTVALTSIGATQKEPLQSEPTQITAITESNNGTKAALALADSSTSWMFISLLILFMFVIILCFFAHRCRKFVERRSNTFPMRAPATEIRYAKYHDEFILQG